MTEENAEMNAGELRTLETRKHVKYNCSASIHERRPRGSTPVWEVVFRVRGRQRSRTFTRLDSATSWRELYRLAGPQLALLALNEPEPRWLAGSDERSTRPAAMEVSTSRVAPPPMDAQLPSRAPSSPHTEEMFADAPLLSTLSEAAATLKVSRGHLLKLVEAGDVVGLKVGKAWVVPRRALALRVEENRALRSDAGVLGRDGVADDIAADLLRTLDDVADSKSVASLLRLSHRTLGDLTRGGALPGIREGTNWVYVSRDLVAVLLASSALGSSAHLAATLAA